MIYVENIIRGGGIKIGVIKRFGENKSKLNEV